MRLRERVFRLGLTAAVIGATNIGNGCVENPQKSSPDHPASTTTALVVPRRAEITPTPSISFSENEWISLSALEKIQNLERRRYPTIEHFDPVKEMILATAQFYCEQTICRISPEETVSGTFFVDSEGFINQFQKRVGRNLTEAEKERELRQRLEFVTDTNQIFINEPFYQQLIHDFSRLPTRGQPVDIDTAMGFTKSLFLHAFSHTNSTNERVSFEAFSIRLPRGIGANLTHLEGFDIIGEFIEGGAGPFYIKGAEEAKAELNAVIIGERSGGYLSIVPEYSAGLSLIKSVNRRANISDQEFLEYVSGDRPLREFLRRWGSLKNRFQPDEKAAVMALAVVGIRVQADIQHEEAIRAIENYLGIRLN